MNFTAYSHLKVFVRDFSIAVSVKFVKKLLELLFSDPTEAPVLEIEPELLGLNGSRFLYVQVHEGLA